MNNLISDRSGSIKLFIHENKFKTLLAELNSISLISRMAFFHSVSVYQNLKFVESVCNKLKNMHVFS